MILKIIVSFCAIIGIAIHAIFPDYRIDIITVGLFLIGIIPWLSSLIDSFELPGGWKLKFAQLEKAGLEAKRIGLISESPIKKTREEYTFQMIGDSDPNLALAGLRIEIEKKLIELAKENSIGTKMQGAARILKMLTAKGIVGEDESEVLLDMIRILNAAVHGARIDAKAYSWAMEYGPGLLHSLKDKTGKFTSITAKSKVKKIPKNKTKPHKTRIQ